MKDAIIDALKTHGDMSFSDLGNAVGAYLDDSFDGSVGWYYTTVKLDLEARGIKEDCQSSNSDGNVQRRYAMLHAGSGQKQPSCE
ncbi:MAG: hypothetical protein GY759_23435 [Chloroflexi bacterium]|nr:hypothetical protein [Chloroflexota bacterium]